MKASPELAWFSAGLDHVPESDDWLDEATARRLRGMRYRKRYLESRLSRFTAKAAIARSLQLVPEPATLRDIVIRNAADGAPEAFYRSADIDAVIAMTDRADWAVTALLRGGGRVGCDLELVEERSPAFIIDYLTQAEQDSVAASADPDVAVNLIWSAKESALKVMRTGLRRDTREVEVTLHDASPAAWQRLTIRSREGRVFPGYWARFGDFLLTVATERETPAPVSLLEPPPLGEARPSHRWMEDWDGD